MTATSGEVLNARNLKNMGVLKKVLVDPEVESSEAVTSRRIAVDSYPLFSKLDDPEVVDNYIMMMQASGVDTTGFSYDDLPDAPDSHYPKRGKKHKRSEASEPEKKKKKQKQKKDREPLPETLTETTASHASKSPQTSVSTIPIQVSASIPSLHDTIPPSVHLSTTTIPIPTPSLFTTTTTTSVSELLSRPMPIVEPFSSDSDSDGILSDNSPPDSPAPHVSAPIISELDSPDQFTSDPVTSEPIISEPISPDQVSDDTFRSDTPLLLPSPLGFPQTSDIPPSTIATPQTNQASLQMALYKPVPKSLSECINLFRFNACKKIHMINSEAGSSRRPSDIDAAWTEFQQWMSTEFQNLYTFSEITKNASVQIVKERRSAWQKHMAEKRLAAEQREAALIQATHEAEAARLEAERAEAEKQEAARQEGQDSVSGMVSTSDPKLSALEKTLESIQEEQKVFRDQLAQQAEVNNNVQNLLAQILSRLPGPSS